MSETATLHRTQTVLGWVVHGWLGGALVAVFWALNWGLSGLRTHLLFFPLWLGYILTVDALVLRRRGTSLLTRSPRWFVLLFLCSIPGWWAFEVINERTANWVYLGREQFSDLTYFALASIAFSTVMPAVFETAELVRSFRWVEWWKDGPPLRPTRGLLIGFVGLGLGMFTLAMVWPTYCYPLVWGCAFFLLEPINVWRGHRSLFDHLQTGDWRPVFALSVGALTCGFFWELWNVHAYPKWIYHTPGADFWHVFEMPLLGYVGYIPFGLELYALFHLFAGRRRVVNL